MDRDVIIQKLRLLLGDGAKDEFIALSLDTAEEEILNYCNIKEIPTGLTNTLINMAAHIYRNSDYGIDTANVQSITEGDVTVMVGSGDSDGVSSAVSKYRSQLNRYRKLVFHR